jgi:hypothetical protein
MPLPDVGHDLRVGDSFFRNQDYYSGCGDSWLRLTPQTELTEVDVTVSEGARGHCADPDLLCLLRPHVKKIYPKVNVLLC